VRCSEEGVLLLWRPRWSSTHGYAQPHDDGISLGVVEEDPGSVVPSLASGRCSRTTTHGGIVGQHGSLRVTVVVSSVTIASTTTTAGGSGGQGSSKGAREDRGRYYWVGEGRVTIVFC
jgi:hypothetical protein